MNRITLSPEDDYNRYSRLDFRLMAFISLIILFRLGYAYIYNEKYFGGMGT